MTTNEAEAFAARVTVELGLEKPVRTGPTILAAGEAWVAQCETDGLERSTTVGYRQLFDLHIRPFVGDSKVRDLTPAAVQEFRNLLIKSGRSRAMAHRAVSVGLRGILQLQVLKGELAHNVVRELAQLDRRQARLTKRQTPRLQAGVDFPTKDEIRAMLEHGGQLRPLLLTVIFTGLRAAELRGLRWPDVDLDRAVLTVRQRADRWRTIGSPRSDAAKREIPLPPKLVNTLREWRLACPKGEQDLVFPNGEGRVQFAINIHRRGLGPLQVAAGITTDPRRPKYGLEALRHLAASLFIEIRYQPQQLQRVMGHLRIQRTLDVYGHLFPPAADDREAMRRLEACLDLPPWQAWHREAAE